MAAATDFARHDRAMWRKAGKEVIGMKKELYGAGGTGGALARSMRSSGFRFDRNDNIWTR